MGATRAPAAINASAVSAGTFSNSVVTTLHAPRKVRQRRVIEIIADDGLRRHARRRAVRLIGEDANVKAQLRRGDREHAAQLAAAENADRRCPA